MEVSKMQFATSILAFAVLAVARTDLQGCTSSNVIAHGGASVLWYIPGTGEICDFLDCGGGRAPNKKNVPGCPEYTGTDTYSPSFLTGFNAGPASTPTPSAPISTSVVITSDSNTGAPTSSPTVDGELTTISGTVQTTSSDGTAVTTNPASPTPSSTGTDTISAAGTPTSSGPSSSATSNSGVKVTNAGGILGAVAFAFGYLL